MPRLSPRISACSYLPRSGGEGYLHLEKFGPQWLFVTPEGYGLYPLTVAAIYLSPEQRK